MKKIKQILGFIIVFVISAGLAGCQSQNQQPSNEIKIQDPTVDQTTDNIDQSSQDQIATKSNKYVQQSVQLQPINDFQGQATAVRSFNDSIFVHTLRADLPEPSADKFYEGWLVKPGSDLEFFSTGELIKEEDEYELTFETDEDKSKFVQVVITLETLANGLDNKPEIHVMEGQFE